MTDNGTRFRRWWPSALTAGLAVLAFAGPAAALPGAPALRFEANRGQTDPAVRFVARGPASTLFLTSTGAVIALRGPGGAGAVRLTFGGGDSATSIAGVDELRARSHYLIGRDPARWRRDVPNFARVAYREVYPGIDVVFYGREGRLEYDFVVAPGADPGRILLELSGMDRLEVDAAGDLVLHTAAGALRHHRPAVYQVMDAGRRVVDARYVLTGPRRVAIEVAAYDGARPLVIDPVLSYSTYFGGGGGDEARGVALDAAGNAYVVGTTAPVAFPVNPGEPRPPTSQAFVAKLDPAGALVYATYFGGSALEQGLGIAVDAGGHAYVTGLTQSADFPTVNPVQAALSGASDAFVAKLDPAGAAFVYATYLGGSGDERGQGIAVDATGHAYPVGLTTSLDFPTTPGAFQPGYGGGGDDSYVAKLTPDGSALVYATYLGGSDVDDVQGVAVDAAGNAYLAGGTISTNFPTANAFQPSQGVPGGRDAFVTKLDAAGAALVYSTYLGAFGDDSAFGIAVDAAGSAHVTGRTFSSTFPTRNAVQPFLAGGQDAFVTKLDPSGTALVYSTFLGGSGSDLGFAIALDPAGNAYVTGPTTSPNFPLNDPLQATFGGFVDAFVAKFGPTGAPRVLSSYLGGTGDDRAYGVAVTAGGDAVVVGTTTSINFPTANPLQPANGGASDAFVARLTTPPVPVAADLAIAKAAFPDPVTLDSPLTYTLTVTNQGPGSASGVTVTDVLPFGVTFVSATPTQGTCAEAAGTVTCALGGLALAGGATVTIVVIPTTEGFLLNTATVAATEPDPDLADNTASVQTTAVLPPLFDGGGQRPPDVNAFLRYANPLQARTDLPAGTTTFDVVIYYGDTIDPATFQATLNGAPLGGFTPIPGTHETVTIPLGPGRNVLLLEVQGVRNDGRTATDRDRLTFIVP